MSSFALRLLSATRVERIDAVSSFVGEDASGSFGILAGHARFMTVLRFGLARFRIGDDPWQYLALPGAVAYFRDNELVLVTRRYVRDSDYQRINEILQQQLRAEEATLESVKTSLHRMEEEMLKRLWQLGRDAP